MTVSISRVKDVEAFTVDAGFEHAQHHHDVPERQADAVHALQEPVLPEVLAVVDQPLERE